MLTVLYSKFHLNCEPNRGGVEKSLDSTFLSYVVQDCRNELRDAEVAPPDSAAKDTACFAHRSSAKSSKKV